MKCLLSIALCTLTAFAARSVRYESPKGEKADLWPFFRKFGKGLAEFGPLGIVSVQNLESVWKNVTALSHIYTGIADSDCTGVEFGASVQEGGSWNTIIFGSKNSCWNKSSNKGVSVCKSGQSWKNWYVVVEGKEVGSSATGNGWAAKNELSIRDGLVAMNGTQFGMEITSSALGTSGSNLYLGRASDEDSVILQDWYYLKLYGSEDRLVRDYVPAKRLSDAAVGFFDKVNETFSPSSGDQDFVAGSTKAGELSVYSTAMCSESFTVYFERYNPKEPGPVCVYCDSASVARLAARELLRFDFADYAFVPYEVESIYWSRIRSKVFSQCVVGQGKRHHVFECNGSKNVHPGAALREWLLTLPRPCGIFAANDMVAESVLAACEQSGISVPEEMVVIGVDDLEHVCESTMPTLTSIGRDFDLVGRSVAGLLDEMMNDPDRLFSSRPFPSSVVIRRASTNWLNAQKIMV